MNLRKNLHAADGSLLGFFYQIEQVILWLSKLDSEAVVGIEVDDDIVVQLEEGNEIKKIYEQAKHSLKKLPPFSDKSEDLWKTLSIWVSNVINGVVDPDKAIFSPLSNKIIPKSRLIYLLHEASFQQADKMSEAYKRLIETAQKLRKGLKTFGEIILGCPEETLKRVINSIQIIEPTYEHSQSNYKRVLMNNLSMADELPFDEIINHLFGFVALQLIDNWRNRKESWIPVKAFNTQYNEQIAAYHRKPFIERTEDSLPVSKAEIERNRGKVYVEQLRAIDFPENELLEAMHDYFRATTERNRFAKDYEISREKFEQYYKDLQLKWQAISRPRFRNANVKTNKKTGYEVFYETIQYRGKLSNYEPEQGYTYKGAYHHLANELEIGWHPGWEKMFKSNRK